MAKTDDHDDRRGSWRGRDDGGASSNDYRSSRKVPDETHRERRRSRDRRRRSESPNRHRRHPSHRDQEYRKERGDGRRGDRDSRHDVRHRSPDERHSGHRRHRETGDDSNKHRRSELRSPIRRGGPLPSQEASFAVTKGEEPEQPKEKPNFGVSGALAAASNSVAQADGTSVVLKYHEPSEARKPPVRDQWKLFVFKGGDIVDTIDLSLRSCWLVGREMSVVDLPAEHPSISKQHAVIQFRYTEKRNEYGDKIGRVKPYLIDLESANGTILNDDKVPDSRYLELRDKDMIQFGHSTREYVVMLAPKE
ncbi:hypothetical protein QQS21_002344 [Conoideocrella luteorostrata]|uniref:FHA domain-containing protein n=1 Tax=Conoideocrella luteorostrata TaxID=1105319 RepID=A0AAJ0CZG0_9HYPO|nr:hypothetical protein QQS21_002344 [Conoideocrella luteorostrata]